MNDDTACMAIDGRTRWQKLSDKLFPPRWCELPEAPPSYKDVLVNITTIDFSAADRLRILISGKVRVETRTVTENLVGNTVTSAVSYPLLRN